MPIYEFNCIDCSADSEVLVRSSNWEKVAKCPECGSVRLEKKLSVFAPSHSGSDLLDMPPCSVCQATAGVAPWITNLSKVSLIMGTSEEISYLIIRILTGLVLLSVWTWRFNRTTPFQRQASQDMKEEFKVYGLSEKTNVWRRLP